MCFACWVNARCFACSGCNVGHYNVCCHHNAEKAVVVVVGNQMQNDLIEWNLVVVVVVMVVVVELPIYENHVNIHPITIPFPSFNLRRMRQCQ